MIIGAAKRLTLRTQPSRTATDRRKSSRQAARIANRIRTKMTNDKLKSSLQHGLVLAVLLWGIYLATGAVLYNQDYRKGLIMLGCSASFVILWAVVHRSAKAKAQVAKQTRAAVPMQTKPQTSPPQPCWNYASSLGFLLAAGVTCAMMAAAWGGWQATGATFASIFGLAAVSAVASVVGLSNPICREGRWFGMVGLGLLLASFVIGFYVN